MKKRYGIFLLLFLFVIFSVEIYDRMTAVQFVPEERVDVSALAAKDSLKEEDYALIFAQTGLARPAVDALKKESSDFKKDLEMFQQQRLLPIHAERSFLFYPTTMAEMLTFEDGRERCYRLPPLKTGDILLTRSTRTLMFRHGHVALVVDGEKKQILESMMIGTNSTLADARGFGHYPTLMVLRPNLSEEQRKQIKQYAQQTLTGVPYNLFTGIVQKNKSGEERVDSTHCAHLVWQAYKQMGLDLDSDGGWLVTPHDIAKCQELELVFSLGFGKEGLWQ